MVLVVSRVYECHKAACSGAYKLVAVLISSLGFISTWLCTKELLTCNDYNRYARSLNERQLHEEQLDEETVLSRFSKSLLTFDKGQPPDCILCMIWQSPSPGHPSAADEVWYWPKCVLCSG